MSAPKNYGLITSQAELDMFLDVIAAADQPWGLDIETGYSGQEMKGASLHPDYPDSFIVGISFSGDPSWARYVPLAHDYCPQNMTNAVEVARSFWRILRRGKVVIHNAAFELRFMRLWFLQHLSDDPEFGEEVCASNGYFQFFADSMIDSYLAAELESHGLKYITKTAFGHDQADIHSLFQAANPSGKPRTAAQKKALRFNELELTPEVISYCCEDAAWCLSVHWRYYPMVKDMTLYRVERAIVPILCEMEDYGVRYDWPAMKAKAAEGWSFLEKLNAEIQRDLTAATGRPQNVNIGSPQQLVKVLYEEMGLKTRRKTETGNLSTDKQALTGLAQRYKVVAKILAWKQLKKLLGTYLEKYEREYDYAEDGRTHPSHMQVTVSSGRFAVADPPYQQSPKKYHLELEDGTLFECDFRKFIIAPPDHYILGFDFSQVELRMLAGDSKEPALIHAFDNDIDVHTATAALMFNKPIDQVTKEDRDKGKTLNFALLYGMGLDSLAERLGVMLEEAERLYAQYFSAYSNIDKWVEYTQNFGRNTGYVTTRFGRKVVIWEFTKAEKWIQAKGERLCLNAPIQGAAADYMKVAMVRAQAALRAAGLLDRVHLVMNIHDALEYYVHESVDPKTVVDILAPAVSFPVDGLPKIVAEWHKGLSWGSVTEIKVVDGVMVETGQAPEREEYAPDNEEAMLTHSSAGSDMGNGIAVPFTGMMTGDTKWEPEQALRPRTPSELQIESVVEVQQSEVNVSFPVEPLIASPTIQVNECRRIKIRLPDTPDTAQFAQFQELLQSMPGNNTLVLVLPDGEVSLGGAYRSSLTPQDQARVSLVFPGAMVVWDAASIDADELVAGLKL